MSFRTNSNKSFSEFSKKEQKEIAKESGYSLEQLAQEDPYLIEETGLEEYAQELAEEIGDITRDRWPFYCIDWEWAARDLRHDYTSVTVGGTDYLFRAW
jgi:antirestriction protein